MIEIERIEPDPEQPRKKLDPQKLDELAQSIKRHGLFQPIMVRYVEKSDRYRIVAGERRYRAANRAGLTELACCVKTPDAEDVLLHQIVENWQRADLNPFELADSLAILRDANGYSQQQLAKETGKSKGEISKLLAILDLPAEVQALAREDQTGRIAKRHLYAMRTVPTEQQLQFLRDLQQGRQTTESIEQIAQQRQRIRTTGDRRNSNWQRRTFKTDKAKVSFVFRQSHITDLDIINAVRDVQAQLGNNAEH